MPSNQVKAANTLIPPDIQKLSICEGTSQKEAKQEKSSNNQDITNNNMTSAKETKTPEENSKQNENNIKHNSQQNSSKAKLNFIEEKTPIETEEWLVFLQGTMEEVLKGEMMSLLQPNLTNIIVSPLRNSNTDPKVLSHAAKLLSLPLAMKDVPEETLQQIKKVYIEVKLVANLVYSSELLLKCKLEETSASSPNGISSVSKRYRSVSDLSEEDLQSLQYIYMLITHLVHLDNEYLSQFCDSIVILNLYTLLALLLSTCKNTLSIVTDILGILTHVLRVFPENYELINKILLNETYGQEELSSHIVELLNHSSSLVRERICFFLLLLGRNLPANKKGFVMTEAMREIIETLMYDSIESVRMAAVRIIEELKNRESSK